MTLPKITGMKATNEQFLKRVMPEFNSWGLSQHPNPASPFGPIDYGYHYDFADTTNRSDVKLVSFAIIQPNASLWIVGHKAGKMVGDDRDLIILNGNMKGTYRLTRKWSIRRPLKARFELESRGSKDPRIQAEKLIDDVVDSLPKLKEYLYG
jgi:hypothetical protein